MIPGKEAGWLPYYGPVRVVGVYGEPPICITVGNRVKAWWERFGYVLGNGTVVGFEVEPESGWIKVVVERDHPDSITGSRIVRWDWDRTELCPGRWEGETQEESVGRWLAYLERERQRVPAPSESRASEEAA